jgi:MSHA pilin protein MshA
MIKAHQRGFTLIELVVVIVILGILAAFAVPRFMGMEGEARAATVKSFAGSLKAASAMARGKCQAQDCGASGIVSIDGNPVTMAFGYPNAASIASTVDLTTAGFTVSSPTATTTKFLKTGGGATCFVTYAQATSAVAPPVLTYGAAGVFGTATFNAALATACAG